MQILIADGYIASEIETFEKEETFTARFTVGVKSGFGEGARTDFFMCVCFGNVARNLSKYKHKGDYVFIRGTLKNNLYTGSDGKKKLTVSIICQEINYGHTPKVKDEKEDVTDYLKTNISDDSEDFNENLPF